jgi:hypothetical protein
MNEKLPHILRKAYYNNVNILPAALVDTCSVMCTSQDLYV